MNRIKTLPTPKFTRAASWFSSLLAAALFVLPPANVRAQSPPDNNLELWLEANVGIMTNSAGAVTNWIDQSLNGFDVAPTGGANPPVYLPSALNGLPSVQFNSNQWLQLQSPLDIVGDLSEFVVLDLYSVTSVERPITFQGNPNNGVPEPNQWFILNAANGINAPYGESWVQRGDGSSSPVYGQDYSAYTSSSPVPTGRYLVLGFTAYHNPNVAFSETVLTYLNGGGFGQASTGVNPPVGAGLPMNIGGIGGVPLDGEIAELLVYGGALNTNDVSSVWSYLSNKYNIQYSLPAVAIISPTNGTVVGPSTNITVNLSVSDPLVGLASVKLYANGNLLSTATAPPYQFTVNVPQYATSSGTVSLLAVATDTNGVYANSAPVTLMATGPTNYPASTNLQFWLEANVGISTNSAGGVIGWADQSGHSNNAYLGKAGGSKTNPTTQANPAVLDTNFLGGMPGIHFYGANNEFMEVSNAANLEITGDISSVVVAQVNAQLDARFIWWMGGFSGYPSPNGVMTGGYSSYTLIRGNGGSQQEYNFASDPYYYQANVIINVQQGANYEQFLDSALNAQGYATATAQIADGEGNSPMFIATRGDTYAMNNDANGDSDLEIAEIMIFNNALTGTNLTSVENYIGAKYFNYIAVGATQFPSPTLSVTRQPNGSLLISWPASYMNYILQSTPTLSSPNWTAVAGVANNQVDVTPTAGQSSQFYRLQYSP